MTYTPRGYVELFLKIKKDQENLDKDYRALQKLKAELEKIRNETDWDNLLIDYNGTQYILYNTVTSPYHDHKSYVVNEVIKEAQ